MSHLSPARRMLSAFSLKYSRAICLVSDETASVRVCSAASIAPVLTRMSWIAPDSDSAPLRRAIMGTLAWTFFNCVLGRSSMFTRRSSVSFSQNVAGISAPMRFAISRYASSKAFGSLMSRPSSMARSLSVSSAFHLLRLPQRAAICSLILSRAFCTIRTAACESMPRRIFAAWPSWPACVSSTARSARIRRAPSVSPLRERSFATMRASGTISGASFRPDCASASARSTVARASSGPLS